MIFQNSPLTLYIVSQRSKQFSGNSKPGVCINIKVWNRDNKKQMNILKNFLECLEIYILLIDRNFGQKLRFIFMTNDRDFAINGRRFHHDRSRFSLLIASAKIPEREGNFCPAAFVGNCSNISHTC